MDVIVLKSLLQVQYDKWYLLLKQQHLHGIACWSLAVTSCAGSLRYELLSKQVGASKHSILCTI